MEGQIDLVVSCSKWAKASCIEPDFINKIFNNVLLQFESLRPFDSIKIIVLLTNNSYMRRLNKTYRNKDKATNVLSFAELKIDYKEINSFSHKDNNLFLGNIALGYEITKKEATELSVTFSDHFSHLLVHGILHLLGFDHETDKDAIVMESLEEKILHNLSVKYIK
jgi:probable rRNA maturation factor